ncbi:MAG: hypothetical protein LBH59_03020 [Planctomycetaceae bacterium]|nr:hypothetical protein [Planctomycetaceae bacterium]
METLINTQTTLLKFRRVEYGECSNMKRLLKCEIYRLYTEAGMGGRLRP